jgi:hypothetical protein
MMVGTSFSCYIARPLAMVLPQDVLNHAALTAPVSRGPQGESLHIVTFDLITGRPQNVNRAFGAIFSYVSSDLTRGHFLQPSEGIRVFPHEKNQSSCLRPRRLNMDFTKSIEHHP